MTKPKTQKPKKDSLVGPAGPAGPVGPQGERGETGKTGDTLTSGLLSDRFDRVMESTLVPVVTLANVVEDHIKIITRVRLWQRIAVIGLVFDLLLSCGFAWLLSSRQHVICRARGQTRKVDSEAWHHVLGGAPIPQPGETPAQIAVSNKRVDDFNNYINASFSPRKC